MNKKNSDAKADFEIETTVTFVDINTVPPAQAIAMQKARRIFDKLFRKAEGKARKERDAKTQ